MLKRWRRLMLVFLAIPVLVLGVQTPAMALDDWGITGDFNNFPFTSNPPCDGNLEFFFEGYRYTSNTVTLKWNVPTSGTMQIRPYDPSGPAAPARSYGVYHLGNNVWFAHWTASLPHSWHFGWHPNTGGVCIDTVYVK
jgi:hypothetical protein